MAQVRDQSVGHVDCAHVATPTSDAAEREPGLRQAEPLDERRAVLRGERSEFAAHGAQAKSGIADGPRDVDVVARARA